MRSGCTATSCKTAGSMPARTAPRLRRGGGVAAHGGPPRCAECGNLVRPGVVWFGEMLPALALAAGRARRATVQRDARRRHVGRRLAGGRARRAARRAGAWVAIVNPNESEIDDDVHRCCAECRPTAARAAGWRLRSSPARRPFAPAAISHTGLTAVRSISTTVASPSTAGRRLRARGAAPAPSRWTAAGRSSAAPGRR